MQNPLQKTVLDAGSILGLTANLCSRPVAATEIRLPSFITQKVLRNGMLKRGTLTQKRQSALYSIVVKSAAAEVLFTTAAITTAAYTEACV